MVRTATKEDRKSGEAYVRPHPEGLDSAMTGASRVGMPLDLPANSDGRFAGIVDLVHWDALLPAKRCGE